VNELELKTFLDQQANYYNSPAFVPHDPVSIPRRFSLLQDIEIMGFLAATLAWGQRVTIIQNCERLIEMMGGEPYQFMLHPDKASLKAMSSFVHRTFNGIDLQYFIRFFHSFYREHYSLESAFSRYISEVDLHVGPALSGFHKLFFSMKDAPSRTRKHVATPERKSACKRLNMFLRWMVRKDNKGVDFGLWQSIKTAQLVCPCDVHVNRIATELGLIAKPKSDWQTALELTSKLRDFDPQDPVKYDFALFGLGAFAKSPMKGHQQSLALQADT
jgi:uncharacterized protein (TIGR02757 family)